MAIRIELRRRALLRGALGSLLAALLGPRLTRRAPRATREAAGDRSTPTAILWIGHR